MANWEVADGVKKYVKPDIAIPFDPKTPTCQFPMWKNGRRPNQKFCGCVTVLGPYCLRHALRCFIIKKPKKKIEPGTWL
jgi:hypothetical protein